MEPNIFNETCPYERMKFSIDTILQISQDEQKPIPAPETFAAIVSIGTCLFPIETRKEIFRFIKIIGKEMNKETFEDADDLFSWASQELEKEHENNR